MAWSEKGCVRCLLKNSCDSQRSTHFRYSKHSWYLLQAPAIFALPKTRQFKMVKNFFNNLPVHKTCKSLSFISEIVQSCWWPTPSLPLHFRGPDNAVSLQVSLEQLLVGQVSSISFVLWKRKNPTDNYKFALCRCLVASAVINIPIFYKIQQASMSGEAPKDKGHH